MGVYFRLIPCTAIERAEAAKRFDGNSHSVSNAGEHFLVLLLTLRLLLGGFPGECWECSRC